MLRSDFAMPQGGKSGMSKDSQTQVSPVLVYFQNLDSEEANVMWFDAMRYDEKR